MTAINLQTEARCRVNSPRDLEDASEVSVCTDISVAIDATDGATFINTGNQLLGFTWAGGGSDAEGYHILRNGVSSEYVGLDVGDDSGHAYDLVTVPETQSDQGVMFVGPFDPNRYNDANGLLTIKPDATTASDNTAKVFVLDISSRRTARSTATR